MAKIQRFRLNPYPWPRLGLVDLTVVSHPNKSYLLVPRTELGADWINNHLNYSGARSFSGGVPIDFEEIDQIVRIANRDGLKILSR